jgi:flagellar hook-associated protein 2
MGTVGLSFGSPTSGAGFDVSSTVAQIVSNLQNVETPWKNQLTSLESQDTVISNLGTLFSNLSNDLSSLTDFQGILAQKEGSSSDTNVVELTSASASATAGTYTIVVNSLATTANGYLDPIANASGALTGSITINGSTVDVPDPSTGNNTLAGLAAAINGAGIGVTASVITDANGSRLSLESNTSGGGGSLSVTSNIADGSTSLKYNANLATGANASLSVNGVDYEAGSNTVSNLIPGVTFQLLGTNASGSDVQVVIGNDNSDIESTVNQFVTDYNSLISAVNTQEGNNSSGNPEPLFGSPTLSLLQQQLLDGINTETPNGYLDGIQNASDTLSGSISITVSGGTAHTVNVGDSSTPATLAGLAQAINAASIGVTANVVTNSSGSQLTLVSNTAGAAGALTVNSSITDQTTNTALNYNSEGTDFNSLTGLGISVNDDGSLTFDANSLDSVLNTDFPSVVGFFQNANSWGQSFSSMLNNAGTSSSTGILALASSSNSSIESTLNAEISNENSQISAEQTSLTTELNSANEIMQQLPTQLQGINELYSAITGYNENTSG